MRRLLLTFSFFNAFALALGQMTAGGQKPVLTPCRKALEDMQPGDLVGAVNRSAALISIGEKLSAEHLSSAQASNSSAGHEQWVMFRPGKKNERGALMGYAQTVVLPRRQYLSLLGYFPGDRPKEGDWHRHILDRAKKFNLHQNSQQSSDPDEQPFLYLAALHIAGANETEAQSNLIAMLKEISEYAGNHKKAGVLVLVPTHLRSHFETTLRKAGGERSSRPYFNAFVEGNSSEAGTFYLYRASSRKN